MSKEIKDYLHLYLGGKCLLIKDLGQEPIMSEIDGFLIEAIRVAKYYDAQPILRPLSDMTEEEKREMNLLELNNSSQPTLTYALSPVFYYLLKHGFDLFGLIEDGLAFNKSKSQ